MSYSEASNEDKVYRFISDPKHKENLSGRVRAACITCRRKKIKCGGEIPCNTCEEKGLVCEGLTERKKPKAKASSRRSSDISATSSEIVKADSSSSAVPLRIARLSSTATTAPQRPTIKDLNLPSGDSGYWSAKQTSRPASTTGDKLPFELADPTLRAYETPYNVSPTSASSCDWNVVLRQDACNHVESDITNHGDVLSVPTSVESIGWSEQTSPTTRWWPDNTSVTTSATNLISTARLLEEQAQSLRRLATGHDLTIGHDNRRQTVNLPLTQRFNDGSSYSTDAFDDMALLFTARTADGRSMSVETGLNSWISVDSDYSTTLDFPQILGSHNGQARLAGTQDPELETSGWHHTMNQNNCSNPTLSTSSGQQRHLAPKAESGEFAPAHDSTQSPFAKRYGALHPWPE